MSLTLLPQHIRTRCVDNLATLMWDDKLMGTRFLLAVSEFFWGSTLLIWGVQHHLFTRPTYKAMDALGSELGWGLLFLWSAGIQLAIVLMGDIHSRGARVFAFCNALLWIVTVVGALVSVYPPPSAMGAEFAAALAAIWIVLRPHILARIIERARYAARLQ